jgi:hypothetical protein
VKSLNVGIFQKTTGFILYLKRNEPTYLKMKKTGLILIIFAIAFGLANCKKEAEEPGTDINKSIVINELLPKNQRYGSDQNGQFDDWIELYNLANQDIDISGFYLTDSKKDLKKWKIPSGTILSKKGYLIIWADGDSLQAGLHTNYKLSAEGENVVLVSPDEEIIDLVEYPTTTIEQSWARIPNGTGSFAWTVPTFNQENK